MKKLNHFHFAILFVVAVFGFLWHLVSVSPEIPLGELTGEALHRLALWTGYVWLTLATLGGLDYRVIDEIKKDYRSMAFVVAAIIIGSALVLGR